MRTDKDIEMIRYFWKEKGDLERWSGWEEAKADYPEVERAWDEYKRAERFLDLEVGAL